MLANLIRKCIPARFRPVGYFDNLTHSRCDGQVRAGPFKGTRYIHSAHGSSYVPKLLGIYERELYPTVEHAIAADFPLIIDIGAAEGYYAVGMARRCPKSKVVAYEMEPGARDLLHQMIELNGLNSQVEIRGKCDVDDLARTLANTDRSLVICDCEGFESELLSLERAPALRHSAILVEMHDFLVPGVTDKLLAHFRDSHTIERIDQADRSPAEFPFTSLYISCLPRSYLDWAVSEGRPVKMHWLWMLPR